MTTNVAEVGSIRRRRSRHRRRLSFALAASIAVALLAADSYLKNSAHLGYYPAEAAWVAYTNELGGFWKALEATDLDARLGGAGHYPLQQWELDTRLSVGIRPTPGRWSVWFGQSFVLAGGEGGIAVCLRPGLLLRAADFAGRALGTVSESGGVSRYGDWAFAWRDGYLLASPSASVVEALRESGAIIERDALSENGAAGFRWRAGRDGEIVLTPEDGLPVRGWIAALAADSDSGRPAGLPGNPAIRGPGMAERLSVPPLLTLTGTASEELADLIRHGLEHLPASELFYPILENSTRALPEGWAAPGIPFEFALAGVDTSEDLAIPEMAYVTPVRIPDYTGSRPPGAVKHEWGTFTGWIRRRPWNYPTARKPGAAHGRIGRCTCQSGRTCEGGHSPGPRRGITHDARLGEVFRADRGAASPNSGP